MWKIVFSKNSLFFFFFLFCYIFGVLLYDVFDIYLDFTYIDELMAFFLVLFTLLIIWERRSMKYMKPLCFVGGVFVFYILYSCIIHSNATKAIFMDFIIQVKPFLGFFCTYLLKPKFTQSQKKVLVILCLLVGVCLLYIGINDLIYVVFGHPARFATTIISTAFLFFYCTTYTWSDIITFVFLLTIGLFSTRSKFYGFWGAATLLVLYLKTGGNLKITMKNFIIGVSIIVIVLFLSWEKIALYYIYGAMNSKEMWSRPAMFVTAAQILIDYFPFGCGLGSFGSFASGEYYSHIYDKYGISDLWGISRENSDFVADAYYPGLAQFGIVGVILYFYFWYYVLHRALKGGLAKINKNQIIIILSFMFFFIEGIADATFTHHHGLFILIITAMALNEIDKENEYQRE